MKVFDGNEFLASKGCEIKLSNGQKYVVKDLSDDALEALTTLSEETSFSEVRHIVTKALGAKAEDIQDVGIIELQGALNFLSESLFATESPNEMTKDSSESSQ